MLKSTGVEPRGKTISERKNVKNTWEDIPLFKNLYT
jgi:hypothetical protein